MALLNKHTFLVKFKFLSIIKLVLNCFPPSDQNMVAMVAQAMALNPRRLEVAPSNMNIRSAEFPPLTVPGAVEVEPAG